MYVVQAKTTCKMCPIKEKHSRHDDSTSSEVKRYVLTATVSRNIKELPGLKWVSKAEAT